MNALPRAIRQIAREEAQRVDGRYLGRVASLRPITVELHRSHRVISTDEDLELGQWLVYYHARWKIETGDVMLIERRGSGWVATDVISDDPVRDQTVAMRVGLGSDQATSTRSEFNKVSLDRVQFDTHSSWDAGNNAYIVPVDGYYIVSGTAHLVLQNDPQVTLVSIYQNGDEDVHGDRISVRDGVNSLWSVGVDVTSQYEAGDRIDLRVFNNGARALTVQAGTYLSIARLV